MYEYNVCVCNTINVGAIGSPVGTLVGLGRTRSELSATRRVAGPDGLSDLTWKAIQLLKSDTRLREAFIQSSQAHSGAGSTRILWST